MSMKVDNTVNLFQISLHRSVPDTRDSRCNAVHYDASLPTTSVIIIFTNEAWYDISKKKLNHPYNHHSLVQGIPKGGSIIVPLTSCMTGL